MEEKEKSPFYAELIKRIGKLLTIKSIVTIIVTIVFAILSLRKDVNYEQFLTIFTVIIAFYFGTQTKKDGE